MGYLMVLVGMLGVPVCLVMLLIKLIRKKPKKRVGIALLICIVLFFVGCIIAPSSKDDDDNEDRTATSDRDTEESNKEDTDKKDDDVEAEPTEPTVVSDFDTTGYMMIDDDVLYEYREYIGGENIVTVITVEDVGTSYINANTENNDSFFFSINCSFENRDDILGVQEGQVLTVAGIGKDDSKRTASLEQCKIIGLGEIADDLQAGAEEQRAVCEELKQQHEQAEADALAAERDAYISECETVDYSDVERNPDNYDGKKVKFSGEVVQVSEGLFNSVTLRVSDGGDVWYVNYYREEGESRILEGDYITCYGECDGVTSYTNVMGAQVTIPSMDMEYYD